MRIEGPRRTGAAASGSPARRTGGSGFSLPSEGGTAAAQAATAPRTLTDIASLLALQEVGDVRAPDERRGRMIRRGKKLLDILDELRAGLLGGGLAPDLMERLETSLREAREETGDPGLDDVLAAVEVRARVEAAKLAQRR